MTVLVVAVLLGCLTGVHAGGHVRNVARLRLRRWWLLLLAVAIQGTLSVIPKPARVPLLVLACLALVVWCASNLHVARVVPGMVVLGIGILSNTLEIALNGGMPVSRTSLVLAGLSRNANVTRGHLDKHVTPAHVHLGFLGDFIPIPVIHNVLSVGDAVMLVGIFLVVRAATLAGVPARSAGPSELAPVGGGELS